MLSVDCFVFSYSCCTLGYSRFSSSYPRTRRQKDCRSLSSSTLSWFTWVCAGYFLFSLWVRISLPTGAASPPETVRCSLLFSVFAHLAIKRFKSICPPHLCPLFSVRRHRYDNGIFTVSQLLNEHGLLLSYLEFLKKFQIPVKPKDYAVICYVISSKVISLLRNSAHYTNADQQPLYCDILFIGDINVVKDKCSNRYIRNMLKKNFVPYSTVFWSSKYENIEWKKVWSITNKFFISNKVKEVSFKILHRIYPVK